MSQIKLIHGDCLEKMKNIPDGSVDLVLTDPPYGIGISKNPFRQKFQKKEWDSFIPTKEYFDEMIRVSKNQIIWGGIILRNICLHPDVFTFGIRFSQRILAQRW